MSAPEFVRDADGRESWQVRFFVEYHIPAVFPYERPALRRERFCLELEAMRPVPCLSNHGSPDRPDWRWGVPVFYGVTAEWWLKHQAELKTKTMEWLDDSDWYGGGKFFCIQVIETMAVPAPVGVAV